MSKFGAWLQGLIAMDKTAIVAAVVNIAIALTTSRGLHLNGTQVGELTAIVAAGVGWLTHIHFTVKERPKPGKF